MGTVRSISGLVYAENVTLEEALVKMAEFPTDGGYFIAPFRSYTCVYVNSATAKHCDKKCAKGDTVIVVVDAENKEYRRFIFRP